jgi:hypothetical protein
MHDVHYAQPPIRGTLNEGVQHEREYKEGTTIQWDGLPRVEETHALHRGCPHYVMHLVNFSAMPVSRGYQYVLPDCPGGEDIHDTLSGFS